MVRSACYTNERQHHVHEQPTIHFENDFDKKMNQNDKSTTNALHCFQSSQVETLSFAIRFTLTIHNCANSSTYFSKPALP